MRTHCLKLIEFSWTCFMVHNSWWTVKKETAEKHKQTIQNEISCQCQSHINIHWNWLFPSCLWISSVSTYPVSFSGSQHVTRRLVKLCKNRQKERQRGTDERQQNNRWFKPLLYTFPICLSPSFCTPFFLNLLKHTSTLHVVVFHVFFLPKFLNSFPLFYFISLSEPRVTTHVAKWLQNTTFLPICI